MDYKEELRQNEIHHQTIIGIGMIEVMLSKTKSPINRDRYIKTRNSVLVLVEWGIRPHVLYRINKHYQHLL